MAKEVTKRSENYSQWYDNLVVKADLAERSAVRGCMVIKPYGYAIWEKMQRVLDDKFKETGHQNAYFPLFIPKSFLSREAEHVEGFAKECAVVTHHRLMANPDGPGVVVDPSAKLEEELVVRPTSETIIWNTYKNWVTSWRDLPILCNQWANVVRWEMRTRQRFAGALDTLTIEAMMQDGKALQAGTSHFLGQNFAKAFDVQFTNREGKQEYVWATSWGVSTRLMGALIMAHGDDNGLVLPPKLAPIQVVMVPIYKSPEERASILGKMDGLKKELEAHGHTVRIDDRDTLRPGFKFAEWELKGVPVRIAIGARDMANGTVELARRDTLEKVSVSQEGLGKRIEDLLDEIQANIYAKALKFRDDHIVKVDTWDDFKAKIEEGGFLLCHWDGTTETEERIKEETKATIRCIPVDSAVCEEEGRCIYSGKPSHRRVLFARSY